MSLPYFVLTCSLPDKNGEGFSFSWQGRDVFPEPFVVEKGSRTLCVLGNPILNGRINKLGAAQLVCEDASPSRIQEINGEFLIFIADKSQQMLQVINDRFCSIPLFYFLDEQKTFKASLSYSDLWLENDLRKQLDPYAFFEFMWFQRLLGDKTFDARSRFLPAATVLTFRNGEVTRTPYWRPSFQKTREDIGHCADEYVRLLKRSLKMKTSDSPRAGLMLSGGHDSRTVLGAMETPPVCFTLAVSHNTEYRVAKQLADIVGAKHVYLPIPDDKYSQIYQQAVRLGGGMFVYDHALFLGYGDIVRQHADVVFHGHGLDYMFQGMYVPVDYMRICGKRTYIPRLRPITGSAVDYFVNAIPYRLKDVDLKAYLKPAVRESFSQRMQDAAHAVLEDSGVDFPGKYEEYEYLMNHALSRHYSNPNISSLTTYAEQRTPTFENDLYDFYLSLPPEYRLGGRMAREGLKRVNKKLANAPTANLRMRAVSSPYEKTLLRIIDGVLRKTKIISKPFIYTDDSERTWPKREDAIRQQPILRRAVAQAARSERIADLGIFDMDALTRESDLFLEGKNETGALMATLVTVDLYLGLR